MKNKLSSLIRCAILTWLILAATCSLTMGNGGRGIDVNTPLDMESLTEELSFVRGEKQLPEKWPRTIEYEYETYDFREDIFKKAKRVYRLDAKPLKIIPHSVGIAEILWAISPRSRIIAYNDLAADPNFSLIASEVKQKGRLFNSRQVELVIGYQPDLVFIVFYTGADFKNRLSKAHIPIFDPGYFGTFGSIKEKILLIGKVIGEEGNAEALVMLMDHKIFELRKKLPETGSPIRVLYYSEGGYVPGSTANFNSICEITNLVNVGTEKGIKSWLQVDYETLLKWDPDVIIVPEGSSLKEQLLSNKIMAHANAVKAGKIYDMPGKYLGVESQYIILSANLLAGIVYKNSF